jgi:hypothetical protein
MSGQKSHAYKIFVYGSAGTSSNGQGMATFMLTLKNPCVDSDYVQIVPSTPVDPVEYTVFDGQLEQPFASIDEWSVTTSPITHNFCGKLILWAYWDNVRFMNYDWVK